MLSRVVFLINILIYLTISNHVEIPLTYAYSQESQKKYPIELSFQSSQTFTPFQTDTLYLYNANISIQTQRLRSADQSVQKVIIGLKNPSQFIRAVSEYYKVSQTQIQFGKQQFLKLIINDLSFIQSQDIFYNHAFYTIDVKYNYGQSIQIPNEQIQLFDGDNIYWNQILIRRILNNLKEENGINFKFNEDNHTIALSGHLQNFPQITVSVGTYLFKIDIGKMLQDKQLNYKSDHAYDIYSSSKEPTRIGLALLSEFSKFQIDGNSIIFKRTSQLFELYLFLAYFFLLCLFIIFKNREDNFKTIQFVRNIFSWLVLKDNTARIEVLRTELQ